jgi:type I restriction enzyme R subunit
MLVVNMFLTGFDSKRLNTLYVDKNLRYHGLIQAYSRTNRLLDSTKPHGNIVSFRNLKEATDKALALFGDENAKEIVFKKPYEVQKQEFETKLAELRERTPLVVSVDELQGEDEKAGFVTCFRDLLRIKSSLETFAEFSFDNLGITEQEFYDYQSKYLDIYEDRKKLENNTESVLDDIDFELELTVRDLINFDYIIQLITGLKNITSPELREKKTEEILKVFDRDVKLRKKKELIRKFIEENLPKIEATDNVEKAFGEFWNTERGMSLQKLAEEEHISFDKLESLIGEYLYSGRLPKGDEIISSLENKEVSILKRQGIIDRVKNAIEAIVDVFEW